MGDIVLFIELKNLGYLQFMVDTDLAIAYNDTQILQWGE